MCTPISGLRITGLKDRGKNTMSFMLSVIHDAMALPAVFIVSLYSENAAMAISAYYIFNLIMRYRDDSAYVEDGYQAERGKMSDDGSARINVQLVYKGEPEVVASHFKNVAHNLPSKLATYDSDYQGNFCRWLLGPQSVFTDRQVYEGYKDSPYKFFLDEENKQILASVKHEHIGGSFLLTLFHCTLQTDQICIFPKSDPIALILLPRLFYYLYKGGILWSPYKPLPLFSENEKGVTTPKRYQREYIIGEGKEPGQTPVKVIALYNSLTAIHKALKLDRPIRAYIPVAFQPLKNVHNNIGLIWISFNPNSQSIEDLHDMMYGNRYQAGVSNASMIYLPKFLLPTKTGSTVRSMVDVVVSFMIGSEMTPGITLKASWTYDNPSEYPVYAAIGSVLCERGYAITETLTVSTPALNNSLLSSEEVHTYTELE